MVIVMLTTGCYHFERISLPLKNRVDPKLRHEELVRIDNQLYVRVVNPQAPPGDPYSRYRYIPADEYLAEPDSYRIVAPPVQEIQEDEWRPVVGEGESPTEIEAPEQSDPIRNPSPLRKKLMVVPFRDLTDAQGRGLSALVMTRFIRNMRVVSDQVVLFDVSMVKEAPPGQETDFGSVDLPGNVRWIGQSFGIHAVVTGTISHAFVSSKRRIGKGEEHSACAIVEIDAQLIDTVSGRVLHQWEKRNSIFDAEAQGDFPEEIAQIKAIDIITSELSGDIVEELKALDWYTTIANVETNRVYINAGKLSGIHVGDVFRVYPEDFSQNPIGEIRVTRLFGLDASMGSITHGSGFQATHFVRPVFQ
jgi:hypothetical protein